MAHVKKYLLSALDAKTAAVIRQKLVYNQYVAECFAADWHINARTRTANIYIDNTLIFGYESPAFKTVMAASNVM